MHAVAASRPLGGTKTLRLSAPAPKNKQSAGAKSQQQAPSQAPSHTRNFIAENIRSLQVRVKNKIDIADDEDTGLALAEIAKRRAAAIRARREEHERGLVPPKHSRNFILENVNNIAKLAKKVSQSKQNKTKQYPILAKNRGPNRRKGKDKELRRTKPESPTEKLMLLGRNRDRSELRRGAVLKELAQELAKGGINTGGMGEAQPSRRRRRRRRRPPPDTNTGAKNKKAK